MAPDKKIHIQAKEIDRENQGVIRLSQKAYGLLMDVVKESGMSRRDAASQIIIQAVENGLIVYDREEP